MIDLRDLFAGMAMQGIVSTLPSDIESMRHSQIADDAYIMADAMLDRGGFKKIKK